MAPGPGRDTAEAPQPKFHELNNAERKKFEQCGMGWSGTKRLPMIRVNLDSDVHPGHTYGTRPLLGQVL